MSLTTLRTASPWRRHAQTALRVVVVGLEAVVGVGALYGGVSLLTDTWQLPPEWLAALPFEGWTVPGLLLIVLIGVPGLAGAALEASARNWMVPWSLAYGVGLMAWIGVQVLMVPPFFLQPVIAAAGAVIAGASWTRLRLLSLNPPW
jgi:hypothetical protein